MDEADWMEEVESEDEWEASRSLGMGLMLGGVMDGMSFRIFLFSFWRARAKARMRRRVWRMWDLRFGVGDCSSEAGREDDDSDSDSDFDFDFDFEEAEEDIFGRRFSRVGMFLRRAAQLWEYRAARRR